MVVKKVLLGSSLVVTLFVLGGCGGGSAVFGHDAKMLIHVQRTDGTQNMTNFEVYITKNADTALNELDRQDYASTLNHPNWSDEYTATRSNAELQLGFRTRSTQTPYFVWVKVPNTGAAYETVRIWIDVDGKEGKKITQNLSINATQRLTGFRIDRSSASY